MYEITIKKIAMKTQPASQSYEKISDTGGSDGGTKYDYVTKPPYDKEVSEVVYQQSVETINIIDTVAAINGVTFHK